MYRILIADDHAAVRKALRSLLSSSGFEICGEAINGKEAIEKAQALRPDLILLDFSMPVMNGLEAARELTKLMPEVPLVMFSDHVQNVLQQDARKAGIRDVVSKTDSYDKLVSHARELMNPASGKNRNAPHASTIEFQRPAGSKQK